MLSPASPGSKSVPLLPALAAMTALQMLTSCALMAPAVMAPRIGIDAATLGLYATAACVVGMLTTFIGGVYAGRHGSFRVAAVCAAFVLFAMAVSTSAGASPLLILAGIILGCAYGPETPASSALLWRITPPATRPLVFSIRQTGNQSGMMIGSLTLPWLAALSPTYGYAAVMIAALVAIVTFELMRLRYDPLVRGVASAIHLRDAMKVLLGSRDLMRLAAVSLPFSALQISLNAFLVIYGVGTLELDLVAAGVLLATAQCGGLIGRLTVRDRLPAGGDDGIFRRRELVDELRGQGIVAPVCVAIDRAFVGFEQLAHPGSIGENRLARLALGSSIVRPCHVPGKPCAVRPDHHQLRAVVQAGNGLGLDIDHLALGFEEPEIAGPGHRSHDRENGGEADQDAAAYRQALHRSIHRCGAQPAVAGRQPQ